MIYKRFNHWCLGWIYGD